MLHNILIFLVILLIINLMIVLWPYTLEVFYIMYLDGIMPICTGFGIS